MWSTNASPTYLVRSPNEASIVSCSLPFEPLSFVAGAQRERMKFLTYLKRGFFYGVAIILWQSIGGVHAEEVAQPVPIVGARPAMGTLTPQSSAPPDLVGTVGELIQKIQDGSLVELRTTYNGSYGASVLFNPPQMAYYVALFQDRHFWRVIKSQDEAQVDTLYAAFVQKTANLGALEIHRAQLQAQKTLIERMIALSTNRAERLQADLDVARVQQARSQAWQQQVANESAALTVENGRTRTQLRQLQREVQQLQRQIETSSSVAPGDAELTP
ncbi:signal peptide protein [Burkholderia lata]|uniref:Signal peptide protein n=2 Tax=Burkholderia lata (strain ATCC 17760 / DSM 23089 / LMG 22485 / NCIMB 9086 / R18194 / 383) TaxID=482957 RepID=A0A6P2RVX6_BURL3|nr:signal peptide protein [Burkholderia lata]